MLKEFKKFALRGNVIDLAVGVIIGAAFNKIVDSLVKDVIMPPIGMLTNGMDFSELYIDLSGSSVSLTEAQKLGHATINYGNFINNVLQFLIVAFAVFLLIRYINRLREPAPKQPSEPVSKNCPFCTSSIPFKAIRCPQCTSKLDQTT